MFSGIRYIFGYTDETEAGSAVGEATPGTQQETTTTTALEQTLNAATTKFTEQLLPQQASIEQLQSSSHQLLPSITEQHEEDESKKSSETATQILADEDEEKEEEDDINVDSWELLDLVDKAGDVRAQSSLISSSVQKDESPVTTQALSKSTSGILKSSSGSSNNTNDNDNLQSRQKQKVSFETPDLVKFKQEIEQTKPKDEEEKKEDKDKVANLAATVEPNVVPIVSSKRNKSNKKAKGSKAQGASAANKKDNSCKLYVGVDEAVVKDKKSHKEVREQSVTEDKSGNPSATGASGEVQPSINELKPSTAKKVPVLNYAKALSAKPKTRDNADNSGEEDEKKNKVDVEGQVAKSVEAQGTSTSGVPSEQSGPLKRSRPLSTSSWSSGDELEPMEAPRVSTKADSGETLCVVAGPSSKSQEIQSDAQDLMDDNESLISSGFSDCDYGFNGLNDYIMRPKKTYTKRSHSGSSGGNSSSIVGMKSRRSDGSTGAKAKHSATSAKGAKSIAAETKPEQQQPVASSKNTKPKKKRMIMATSKIVGSSDFLKQKRSQENKNKAESKQTPRNGSSESSDIAEMDESWFVTPPPCFTGASHSLAQSCKVDQPRAKEAARENALIEHPSIYIASTSRDSLKVEFKAKASKLSEEAPERPVKEAVKTSVALEDSAWASDEDDLSETMSTGRPSDLVDVVEEGDAQIQPTCSFGEIRDVKADSVCLSPEPEAVPIELVQTPVEIPTVEDEVRIKAERRGAEIARPPTQVRPIEPERRPGWQLKRQRSKRRSPLKVASGTTKPVVNEPKPSPVTDRSASNSTASSSRSTPTLIDRIGTSIVSNLTNLTSGLVSSGAMNYCSNSHHANILDAGGERPHQGPLTNRTNSNGNFGQMSRKQMSRGSLKRQNDCTKQGNSLRRPDRRLKMFATPNGASVNRKVHTSIH